MVSKGKKSGRRSNIIHDVEKLSNYRLVNGVQTYTVHWKHCAPTDEPATNLNHHSVWIFWEKTTRGLQSYVEVMKSRELTPEEKGEYKEHLRCLMSLGELRERGDVVSYGFETGNFVRYHFKTMERIRRGHPSPFTAEPGDDDGGLLQLRQF